MSNPEPPQARTLIGKIEPLYWLLLAMPTAIVLKFMNVGGQWIFLMSCVAIIPLAGLMGRATEHLAEKMGPGIGGLLNATFGNAAELIIALLALSHGEIDLVKASITGSIIGNILLVLGLAMLAGGYYYPRQTFNRTAAGLGTTLLALAAIGLIVPTIFYYLVSGGKAAQAELNATVEYLSEEIAVILALMYILSLVFSLRTHRHLFAGEGEEGKHSAEKTSPQLGNVSKEAEPEWSRQKSLTVLLLATAGVALMSEFLVKSVEQAAETLQMNRVFIGVIVVAIIGNAAEHSTAILVAMKNKMDLAVTIAVGSSIQVALFVAPVLIFAGLALGQPLDLHFSPLEVVAVAIAIAVMGLVSQDGECHWMEGALLLAVYAILGLAFYHWPGE